MLQAPPPNGYYWARHPEGTTFVVLREDGHWFCCGVAGCIDQEFTVDQVISPRLEAPE